MARSQSRWHSACMSKSRTSFQPDGKACDTVAISSALSRIQRMSRVPSPTGIFTPQKTSPLRTVGSIVTVFAASSMDLSPSPCRMAASIFARSQTLFAAAKSALRRASLDTNEVAAVAPSATVVKPTPDNSNAPLSVSNSIASASASETGENATPPGFSPTSVNVRPPQLTLSVPGSRQWIAAEGKPRYVPSARKTSRRPILRTWSQRRFSAQTSFALPRTLSETATFADSAPESTATPMQCGEASLVNVA